MMFLSKLLKSFGRGFIRFRILHHLKDLKLWALNIELFRTFALFLRKILDLSVGDKEP